MRKRYLRRILAMILSMLMVIGTVPTSVFAGGVTEDTQSEDITEDIQTEESISDETENLESEVGDEVTSDKEENETQEESEEELSNEESADLLYSSGEHTRDDAVKWAYAQEGKYLDYDNAYGAQCVDLIKYYYAYFGKASYAKGNGCDYVSNALPAGWTRIKNTADFVPQPGDIAVWGTELSKYGHVAIILSANEHSFISMDQNWPSGSACKQVTHTYSKFWGVIRPNFSVAENNPIGAVESASGGIYSVSALGWAFDEDEPSTPLNIHVYIGDRIIGTTIANLARPDVNSTYGCSGNHGYEFTFEVGKEFVGEQTVRIYAINVGGGTNAFLGEKQVTIGEDTSAPVISDCKVTDITSSGYTVTCKVTDDTGVDRVQFPTWTAYNGQDDIVEAWQTNSAASGQKNGNVYTYEVKASEHNYELGIYNTHIYASDRYGNVSFKRFGEIIVPEIPQSTIELGNDFYAKIQNICTNTSLTQVENNNKLDVYFCDDNDSRAQIWHFKRNDNSDTYTILPEENEAMVLEVAGALDEDKTNVQLWTPNGSKAQRWKILKNNGRYCLKPECSDIRVLDTPNGSAGSANAQIYAYNEGTGTGFNIIKSEPKNVELKSEKELVTASYNGHTYSVFEQGMTWSDAKKACEKLGGHLVTITSEGEQKFIESILESNEASMNQYWLGMYRYQDEYRWVTNESSEYVNWNSGEPNGITSNQAKEYCIQMINKVQDDSRFKWNDVNNFNTPAEGNSDFYRTECIGVICEFETLKEYTLSYNANGGSSAPEKEVKAQGTELTISSKKPTREGYNFIGWATKADATKAEYQAGDKYTLNGNITFYAVWEKTIGGSCGKEVTWTFGEDGTLIISGTGDMKNYTYKSEMPWYKYISEIKSVVIEEGVTSIGDYAFYGMTGLTKIAIPKGITSIGTYAFKNCTALDGVQLPATLKKLGESAFFGCSSLTEIAIPEGLYTVWGYTFKNCTKLEKVTFPSTLVKIDEAAFYGCSSLKSLTIPDNVSIIGIYCFKNCTKLSSVQLSANIQQIREAVFYGTAITELKVPDKVTSIGAYAFKNCTKLKNVTFSKNLTKIDDSAFYACSGLTILNLPDSLTDIKDYAFRKCTELKTINFSAGLKTVGESSFYGCEKLTELKLPEGVTDVKAYAFKGCVGVTTITLPTTLKTMGESAFYGCTGISKIEIPKNVNTVGAYAFSRCSKLSEVVFKGNAPTIGAYAFAKVTAKISYPSGNITWSKEKQQNYGGALTWNETK